MLGEDGSEGYHMTIQGDQLSIQVARAGISLEVTDSDARDQYVEDFFYRSLIATVRSTERDSAERDAADLDALAKLHHRLYQGPKVVTSVDL